MNRYTASGLIADATDGKDILLVTRGARQTAAFEELAALAGPVCVLRRANGAQSITFPNGGRIRLTSTPRGHTADIVYIDAGVDDDSAFYPVAHAAVRPGGELIRA